MVRSSKSKTNKIPIYIDRRKNPFVTHYNFFLNNLTVLSKLNEIFKGSFDTYVENLRESTKHERKIPDKIKKELELFRQITDYKTIWLYAINNEFLELYLPHYKGLLSFKENFHVFIREMILVFLISQFEIMLESNFIFIFGNLPQLLKSKDKTIDYEELFTLGDFKSITGRIIKKEARSIIREDIEKINQILIDRYHLINLSNTSEWNKFKERFYRRNLIIHHKSMIDETYRLKTGYSGKETRLWVDDEYLEESFSLFKKFAHILHYSFMNKFIPVMNKQLTSKKDENYAHYGKDLPV